MLIYFLVGANYVSMEWSNTFLIFSKLNVFVEARSGANLPSYGYHVCYN